MRYTPLYSIVVAGIVLLTCSPPRIPAQSLSLFDIDARAYPLMRAQWYAFDTHGARLSDLTPEDFSLTENGETRRIIHASCPPHSPQVPLSAVLTLDVSGSMDGIPLDIARAAAEAWLEVFPFHTSACALTSFTMTNALLQDFTNDRAALADALQLLRAGGGTSFSAALIDPFAGALRVVQRGERKRVVVLLTDGYATGNAVAIFEMARQVAAEVYCVTMEDRMPDLLAQLCDITGGRSYAGVKTADDARMIFRTIVSTAQEDEPCMIEWESEGCDYARRVVLELPAHGVHSVGEYSVDRSMLPELEFLPSSVIEIGAVPPGSTGQAFCTIRAINRSVYVDSIAVSDARFFIADYGGNPPPFSLPPGKTRTLTLSYRALDSSRATCRFTLESNACRPEFFASAGFPGKRWDHRTITLLHPNGGELFIAGSDTVISWEGVAPDEPVRLEFSADNGRSWQSVVKGATGLEYKWRVPVVASDECLVRVTVEEKDPVPDDMVLLGRGRLRMGDMVGTGTALERPVHDVFIDRPFLISVTVITQRAFIDVMGYNPSIMTGSDLLPVNGVSWYMAVEYCNARSRLEGLEECYVLEGEDVTCNFQAKGYRLPTEAEWEYACRANGNLEFTGGGMREPYCTPVDPTLDTLGWYCGNTAALQDVGRRRPNAFGLYDMHGNVQEWCWDYLNVYDPSETIDPSGPPIPSQPFYRVVRGGLYSSYATGCRSSSRDGAHAKMSGMVGFRVVRTY